MSNVVFILGAGASAQCGAPVMSNFLDVADNLDRAGKTGNDREHFERVRKGIGALMSVHSKSDLDITNIESVFAAFEMARTLEKMPGVEGENADQLVNSLKRVIVKTLELTLKLSVNHERVYPPIPYKSFCELLAEISGENRINRTVSVMTFNYDMALDYALHFYKIGPKYHIDSNDPAHGISYLKLHGSLNWGTCNKCDTIVAWHLRDFFSKYRVNVFDVDEFIFDIGSRLSELSHCDSPMSPEPMIVPPTWNKSEHQSQIQTVWKQAALELSDAEYIFIIGYSLSESDAFFRYLYALGSQGTTTLKKIWAINKDSGNQIQDRFASLLGPSAQQRFNYRTERFSDAIPKIRDLFADM